MIREARGILVVEDDPPIQRLLVRLVRDMGYTARSASSRAEAIEALADIPDLVLLDIHLDDGNAVGLARYMAELRPAPEVIAVSGAATPAQAFDLAQCGVRTYITKPFELADIRRAVDDALSRPAPLETHVRHAVPGREMPELMRSVRETAIEQALALAHGNYTAAARMLGISRQAVQQSVRGRKASQRT